MQNIIFLTFSCGIAAVDVAKQPRNAKQQHLPHQALVKICLYRKTEGKMILDKPSKI